MRTKLKTILCLMLAMVCVASFSITAFASEGGEVTTAPDVETTTDTTTETETPVTDETVEDIEIPFNYTIDNDGNLIITIDGVADPYELILAAKKNPLPVSNPISNETEEENSEN